MKTFIIRDYNIQSYLIIAFFIMIAIDFIALKTGYSAIIYLLIAINHIVSSNKKFFSKEYSKSISFKIYYYISMLFMMSLLITVLLSGLQYRNTFKEYFAMLTMYFGMFVTPILAIIYYCICCKDYIKVKQN